MAEQLRNWQDYRNEVERGGHRDFLRRHYVYVHVHSFVAVDVYNLTSAARESLTATGNWAQRPEVVACRGELMAHELLALPLPPRWPDGGDDLDLSVVDYAFGQVETAVHAWNESVQRGNKSIRPPKRPPAFDDWVASRLREVWFTFFENWVEPWKQGGYGLYRDNE